MLLFDAIDTQIYRLALEGKKNAEIADELRFDEHFIQKRIAILEKIEPELYNAIYFKRYMFHNLVDKDLLYDIVKLIFEGFLYIEIATILGITEKEVKDNVKQFSKKTSPFYDNELYNKIVAKNIENETIKEEELFQRFSRIAKAGIELSKISNSAAIKRFETRITSQHILQRYVESNYTLSDQELAYQYHVTKAFVQELLTGKDKEQLGMKLLGKDTMNYIQQLRIMRRNEENKKNKLQIHSLKSTLSTENQKKLQMILLNIDFWLKILFTFRLSLEEFGIIIGFNNLETLKTILYSRARRNTLDLLFSDCNTHPSKEKIEYVQTYLRQLQAVHANDLEQYEELLKKINDYKYQEILAKKQSINHLTEEEVRIVLEYRLKYFLTYKDLPFDRRALQKRCPEDLKEQLELLDEDNSASFQYMYGRHLQISKKV